MINVLVSDSAHECAGRSPGTGMDWDAGRYRGRRPVRGGPGRYRAADTNIHFIKNKRRRGDFVGQNNLNSQADTR